MTSPSTFLLANTLLIEEELSEHRRRFQGEADRFRLERLSRKDKPGLSVQARQGLGRMLIALGTWLNAGDHAGVHLHATASSRLERV